MSVTNRGRLVRLARLGEAGSTAISFALILPVLLSLSFATLEFVVMAFEWHRAGEATRRMARFAAINDPVADITQLTAGSSITCKSSSGAIVCNTGSTQSAATFTGMVAEATGVLPELKDKNVELVYSFSGIGDPTTPAGILPLVTVRIVDLTYDFLVLDSVPGVPASITFRPFTTSQIAGGQ